MVAVYVVSESDGDGKTAVCAALAKILREQGLRATAIKPVASSSSDPDDEIYRRLLDDSLDVQPLDPPDEGLTPELIEKVSAEVAQVSDGADAVFVEGSSELSVEDSASLAESLDARVLVVCRYEDGLDASRLSHWRADFGDRLGGCVINGLTRYRGTDARTNLVPAMEREGLAPLALVPEDRTLLGTTVGQIAEHLEGRFIACEERSDMLVEHFMVGGMGMDPGELYFGVRENKAIIVRGDRPDIQMSALGTPTTCMVLTRGIEPIEYVKYEAEQEEVSVMVVASDTLGTMNSLGTLMEGSRFDHPLKLRRFAELIAENVDVPKLFDALSVKV